MQALRGFDEENVFPRKDHVKLRGLYDEMLSSLVYEKITRFISFVVNSS